jgi:hypothetical protein
MPNLHEENESGAKESREWLQRVTDSTGLTVNAVAKKAGVSASNLHKLMKPDWPYPLKPVTMRRIAAATGYPLPWDDTATAARPGFGEAEVAPYAGEAAASLPPVRKNNADWWRVNTRLLDLEGYIPGDAVLVDLNETPRADNIVVAQITRDAGRDIETVFRKYEPPFLTCRTTSPRYPRPELVDGDRVIIMGVVTHQYRDCSVSAA